MYTLHARIKDETLQKQFESAVVTSISCKVYQASGWTVELTGPDGEPFEPLALNEFTSLRR